MEASLVRSTGKNSALCPLLRIAAAAASPFSFAMSATMIVAPASASASAVAWPMPDAAPVTTATLSLQFIGSPSLGRVTLVQELGNLGHGFGVVVKALRGGNFLGEPISARLASGMNATFAQDQRSFGHTAQTRSQLACPSRELLAGPRPFHDTQTQGLRTVD